MKNLYIIKIGGNIIDKEASLDAFLSDLAELEELKILVHGGGKLATELSSKLQIETKMAEGRRITDAETLKITTMVYAGWINKSIVGKLQSKSCNALGLSGADGKSITSKKREVVQIDYGFVGDVLPTGVNRSFFQNMLELGITPVVSPITCDESGQLLNTNADTIAASIAGSLSGMYNTHLIYCFEKKGVLADKSNENSVINKMDMEGYEKLKSQKIIADGMIPKLDNAFKAKTAGVGTVVIGHAENLPGIIKKHDHAGTLIEN